MSDNSSPGRAEQELRQTHFWLQSIGLTAKTLPIDFQDGGRVDPASLVLTLSVTRAAKHRKVELTQLTAKWRAAKVPAETHKNGPSNQALDELLDRKTSGLFADLRRLPANAIAFYRPFHLEPFDRWGIYIFVNKLLDYARNVRFSAPLFPNISKELLMHLVLFEVFHHEFYHHVVESAATTLEIIADAMCVPPPSFLGYRKRVHEGDFKWHDHQPLEEALANAYAYHALSFISRVKAGYRDALVGSYQKNLAAHWRQEGPGYRDAAHYLSGAQIPANAQLLAMMLGRTPHPGLDQVAQSVMPSGFSAFVGKPDIPTYLVGSPEEVDAFQEMVPAPNETYCNLFWPLNTTRADEMLKKRHQEREAAKQAAKAKQP